MDTQLAKMAVAELLASAGKGPSEECLLETPDRVARAWEEVLSGYWENPQDHLIRQFREPDFDDLVIVKDIEFSSLCEHHLLPFFGVAHVAYIPKNGVITGLSKIARCVEGYARRLQLQERLTAQIADAMVGALNPLGVMVVMEAEHTCMTVRGVRKPGARTVTSAVRGCFRNDQKSRSEVLTLIGLNH